jgi:copper ion binding protein
MKLMKNVVFVLLGIAIISCSGKKPNENPLLKVETATISLPSMVCDKCAKTIRTAIYHVEGVKDVEIDLDKKSAQVKFVPLQTNVQAIEEAVTEAGYDANGRKRNPDAYEKLDKCCKIDG